MVTKFENSNDSGQTNISPKNKQTNKDHGCVLKRINELIIKPVFIIKNCLPVQIKVKMKKDAGISYEFILE